MGLRFDARTSKITTDATAVDFDQPVQTVASTTSAAGLNIPEGTAPTTPVDGDVWVTAAGEFNARLNGATVDLAAGGASSNSFETQTVTDTDSGFTWAETGSAVAASGTDTLTWVSGTDIDIDVDATNDAIRIAFSNATGYTTNTGTVTSVAAGNGLDFTSITGSGSVTMGTPGSLTNATTNAVTATSHTHAVSGFAEITGTPANNQLAIWTNSTTVEGDADLTWDGSKLTIGTDGSLFIDEKTSAQTDVAGQGQIWVRNDTPNTLMFTDDAGTDFEVAGSSVVATKTSNTARSSTTTQSADPDLQFSLGLGSWIVYGVIIWNETAGANQGLRSDFRMTTGSGTGGWTLQYTPSNSTPSALNQANNALSSIVNIQLNDSTNRRCPIMAYVDVTTAGTFAFYWAQVVSNANATNVLSGSSLVAVRVGP